MGDHGVSSNVVNLMDALVWWTKRPQAQKKSNGKTAAKRKVIARPSLSCDGGALRHARRLTSEVALYSSNS